MASNTTAAKLQRAADTLAEAVARRDELVMQMRAEGATIRAIAEAADMSPAGIQRVLERHSTPA